MSNDWKEKLGERFEEEWYYSGCLDYFYKTPIPYTDIKYRIIIYKLLEKSE